MEKHMKKGTCYGVGIGPGDPELLTLKAVGTLERCRVIAAPQTRSGEMLALEIASGAVDLAEKTVVPLRFTMERDPALRQEAHREAAECLESWLDRGEDVAVLNLGDVSIYATWSYLMERLKARGYETVMVPGVTSFCAVAARLGVSLTEGDAPLHIAPGGGSLEETLALPGTKVLMKSGKQMPAVLETLSRQGRLEKSMLVKNCGLGGEEVYTDLSRGLPEDGTGYFATVIVKE